MRNNSKMSYNKGEWVREKLGLSGYLDIFFSCFNMKKVMNTEIMIFFNLVPKSSELCNGTPNQP